MEYKSCEFAKKNLFESMVAANSGPLKANNRQGIVKKGIKYPDSDMVDTFQRKEKKSYA